MNQLNYLGQKVDGAMVLKTIQFSRALVNQLTELGEKVDVAMVFRTIFNFPGHS